MRLDLPTLDEALNAAEGIASDAQQQIQIAAGLLGVPVREVQAMAQCIIDKRARSSLTIQVGNARAPVVVERIVRRRSAGGQ